MGPRPFSHGNVVTINPETATRRRFNGAATFQSRELDRLERDLVGIDKLQWGRDLSVTGTDSAVFCYLSFCGASMGPRPFSHGNSKSRSKPTQTTKGFNGAATFQSRERLWF